MKSTLQSFKEIKAEPLLSPNFPDAFTDIPENAYYNPDKKLWYCNQCHTARQCKIEWPGRGEMTVCCNCDCMEKTNLKKKAEEEKANREIRIKRNRSVGLRGMLHTKKFEAAETDDENIQLHKICKKYADEFEDMYKENIGMKIYGPPGNGKTFYAACIANKVIDSGRTVYMRTMSELINEVQCSTCKNETVQDIVSYDLLIIDDFGAERNTETAIQYVYDIINSRISSEKPFIVTTNISTRDEEMLSIDQKRIFGRFNEVLMGVWSKGNDRRKGIGTEKKNKFKKFLEGIE